MNDPVRMFRSYHHLTHYSFGDGDDGPIEHEQKLQLEVVWEVVGDGTLNPLRWDLFDEDGNHVPANAELRIIIHTDLTETGEGSLEAEAWAQLCAPYEPEFEPGDNDEGDD